MNASLLQKRHSAFDAPASVKMSSEGSDRDESDSSSQLDEQSTTHDSSMLASKEDGRVSHKRKRGAATELAPEKLADFAAAEKRKGLVYLGRIPPGMKPIKIKHLLGRYGEIGRVYLAPEDPAAYKKRVKAGGNKKLRFVEGWVEFMDKRVAEATAELVNNTHVSEEKRGFYSSDLWNIKFLPHFKWHHLTEKLTYERRVRRDKLRSELSAVRKDTEAYVEKVDASKRIKKMEERKLAQAGTELDPSAAGTATVESERARMRRQFKQHTPLQDITLDAIARPTGTRTHTQQGEQHAQGKQKRKRSE